MLSDIFLSEAIDTLTTKRLFSFVSPPHKIVRLVQKFTNQSFAEPFIYRSSPIVGRNR
jgi:hypothetical protein